MNDARGSGSVLAVAVLAGLLCLGALLFPLAALLLAQQRCAAAADLAALAAADVAAGLSPGVPCEAAASVAAANGSVLARCEVEGLVARVLVSATTAGIRLAASAAAGPAGERGG